MSGAGDDRWRGGRVYDSNRQSDQRQPGGGARDRPMGVHHHDRHGHRVQGNSVNATNSWGGLPAGPPQEQHIPVHGFNAAESKDALKKGYQAAGVGDSRPAVYKPTNKEANNARSSGPWASKPNSMLNGKDFFLELRKQISALRQSGNAAGG